PGRHPEAGYRRRYEVPGQPFELPLDGRRNVREAVRPNAAQGMEVVRHIDQNFGAMGDPEPQSAVGQVENSRTALAGPVDAVLALQASGRDDATRIGHVGTIGVYLTGDVGTALCGESPTDPCRDNQ